MKFSYKNCIYKIIMTVFVSESTTMILSNKFRFEKTHESKESLPCDRNQSFPIN